MSYVMDAIGADLCLSRRRRTGEWPLLQPGGGGDAQDFRDLLQVRNGIKHAATMTCRCLGHLPDPCTRLTCNAWNAKRNASVHNQGRRT